MRQAITITFSISVLFLFVMGQEAQAKDFGINGNIYKIIEKPFLQMIDERLQKVDMEQERQKMETIARDRIQNPTPLEAITPATRDNIFFFDPSYILKEDIVLPCGKVLHKAGTIVNPLEHMQLNRRLFFVDSREKEQIEWLIIELKNRVTELKEVEDKVILVGGSPLKLEEQLRASVYFDQHGALITRFGIKHSPALLEQDGLRLKIKEFKLKENR